jgi:hypothetical protein
MVFGHRPAGPVSYFVRRLGAEPAPGCGRDVGYPTPPARIRTSVLTASGSCRESSAPAFGAWAAHAVPVPVMTAHQRRMIRCRARDVVCCHQLPATVQPGTCLTLQTGYMADSFLGLFDRCQRPFGGVTGARACPGSPQEGPGRSAATTTSPAERSAGGPCGPTWASPPHLSSDGPSCTGPAAGPGVSG